MNYTESQLQKNYKLFLEFIKKNFKGDRLKKLLLLYSQKEYGYQVMMAPASAKDAYHCAYHGGYIDHVMNVCNNSVKVKNLYKSIKGTIDFTDEEMLFSALHHDLGKLGDKVQGAYYLVQDDDWKLRVRGEKYKFNPNLQYMDVTDRALFILQQYEIVTTWKETLAIKLADGLYNEASKKYLMSGNIDHQIKTNLPKIIHVADYLSCGSEHDQWKNIPLEKI
jgi:hypothetical protein